MIIYHVTTCNKLKKILKEGLLAQGVKHKTPLKDAVIWFTDKEGIDIVARYWVRSNICVVKCNVPDSYVKLRGITYYGPTEYAMEYYIRVKFKVKWILETWVYVAVTKEET